MPRVLSAALDRHAISACLRDPAGRPSLAVRPWAALAVGLPDVPRAAAAARAEHAPPAAAVPVPEEAPAAGASPAAAARAPPATVRQAPVHAWLAAVPRGVLEPRRARGPALALPSAAHERYRVRRARGLVQARPQPAAGHARRRVRLP